MAVDTPASNDLPIVPPDATPALPSIAGQQAQHTADQPPPAATDDSLPLVPPSILNTSFKDNESGTVWGDVEHKLGVGTRNVIEGVSGLPATLLDAATWPGRVALRAAGVPVTAPSDLVSQGLDITGLPTAQTDEEKRNARLIQGGSSMLTPLGIGSAAARFGFELPALAKPLAPAVSGPAAAGQIVAGGAGAELGDITASSDLVPPWLKPTARLAGNIVGAGVTGNLFSALGTLKNAITGNQSDIASALERLGIKPRTMGAVSDSPGVQGTEALLSRIPTASGVLQPKQRATVDEFGNAVENTARTAETATDTSAPRFTTPQATGQAVQDSARNWRDNVWPVMEDNAWKPVNDVMRPAGNVVDPSGYRAALQRAASDVRLSSMPETQKAFASGQIQKWLSALDADAPPGTNISWNAAQAIKQQIGDALATPDLVNSIGANKMDSLYGGLANDMKISAVLKGAGTAFDNANAVSTAGRAFQNNTLSKVISGKNALKEDISPEQATNSILTGNSTDMQNIRLLMPDAADALAAYKLRQMAQAKPSQQGAGDTTSTGTFLTNLRRSQLDHPEGTSALFSDPAVSRNVSDLGTVAGQLRGVERNMNASNTTAGIAVGLAAQKIAEALASGDAKQIGSVFAGLSGPYAMSKALTSPWALSVAKAQRGAPPPISGLLGGAVVNQSTGQPQNSDFYIRNPAQPTSGNP